MDDLRIRTVAEPAAIALARELKSKAPGLKCGACAGRDFGLVDQPEVDVRTWLERSGRGGDFFGGMKQPLLTLICTRCGHLEQLAEAVVKGASPSQYGTAVDE
jgi:hypothetical protein